MNTLKVSVAKKLVLSLAIFSSIESFACGRSSVLDLQDVSEELVALYDQGKDVRCEIDRSLIKPNDPMYNLHAIGKVTAAKLVNGQPGYVESVKQQENSSWGTGFMISPCHMLTNYHVVSSTEKAIKGKSVNFSFGDAGLDFKTRITGRVVASGDYLTSANKSSDWAVVKFDSLKNAKSVPYIFPYFRIVNNINKNISLTAGYPVRSQGEKTHKIFGMKSVLTSVDTYYMTGKVVITAGNSGSPAAMEIDENGMLMANGLVAGNQKFLNGGDVINGKKEIISLGIIKNQILNSTDSYLMKEIGNAIGAGSCE